MPSVAMVLSVALALPVASLAAVAPRHRTEVLASSGRVTVRAERLPVTQILERMAAATGMKVTYEGSRPTSVVSLDVENVSEVAAVLKLMEGLGISYLLQTDATGEGVDLLIVSGSGAGSVVANNTPAPPEPEEVVPAYDHIPLDPAVLEAQGGEQRPNLNNPYMGLPVQHFPQALAPPPAEGETPEVPQLPQPASYPNR